MDVDETGKAAMIKGLKLPDIRLSLNDPLNDPGQKTFISVMKLNHPQRASPTHLEPVKAYHDLKFTSP